jgi:hypothetical protein
MANIYEPLPPRVKLGTGQQVYNGRDKIKSEKQQGSSANNLMYYVTCVWDVLLIKRAFKLPRTGG